MTAPSGSELQASWGFESADQDYRILDNFFRPSSVAGVHAARPMARTTNLSPTRLRQKGVPVSASVGPKVQLQPDVYSIARLRAHAHRATAADITTLVSGAYQWDLAPWVRGDAEPAAYVDSLSMEIDDGGGRPVLFTGLRNTAMNLRIVQNQIHGMSLDFAGCRDTYAGDVAEVTVAAAFTGSVIVRGHRGDPASTDPIKIKVSTASTAGVGGKVKFTRGATAYGATEHPVVFGEWITVKLADDSRAGVSSTDEFQVKFLDPLDTSELTAGATPDEWSIPAVRTAPTATYSTRNLLQAAGVTVTLGGTTYYLHDIEVRESLGKAPSNAVGMKYTRNVQNSGFRTLSFSLNRDAEDYTLLYDLISADAFAVSVVSEGDQIGSTIYDDKWSISAPTCQVSQLTRDIANENIIPERIEIESYGTYTEQIITSLATIR